MKSGWFKMYRSIIDWEWFKEHDMTCFLLYCLSKANISERVWRGTLIKAGQVVISRSIVCDELGIKDRRYRTIINRLVKSGEISIEPSQKHTIVTIVNWDRYQADFVEEAEDVSLKIGQKNPIRPTTDQQTSNKRPTSTTKSDSVNDSIPDSNGEDSKCLENNYDQSKENKKEPSLDLLFDGEEVPVEKSSKKTSKSKNKENDVDCEFIVKLYNERCPHLPRVLKLNEKRKTKIKLRFAEMENSYETLQLVFDKAEASNFLRGNNDRGWKGDFGWIIENSDNWVKIIEGKYDNDRFMTKPVNEQNNGTSSNLPAATTGRFVSPAERNANASTRQKCDILNTLAECQREFEVGNL